MNIAYMEGYISTKYAETRETAGGKTVTTFDISSKTGRKRDDGKAEYQYFKMDCWHDEHGTQDGIIDGAFAHIECIPRAWRSDKGSGVAFTVRRIWIAPERRSDGAGAAFGGGRQQEGAAVMSAVQAASNDPGAYVETMYQEDIPF